MLTPPLSFGLLSRTFIVGEGGCTVSRVPLAPPLGALGVFLGASRRTAGSGTSSRAMALPLRKPLL